MNNYSKVYWLTRLDFIQGFFFTVLLLSFIGLLFILISKGLNCFDDEDRKSYDIRNSLTKRLCIVVLFVSAIVCIFLPSKSDMIAIYAGGKTLHFVEKDSSIQKIPYQSTKIITEYLESSLKDFKNK